MIRSLHEVVLFQDDNKQRVVEIDLLYEVHKI